MKFELSIIIVNYNSEDCIIECLSSIYEFVRLISFEVIIVDNNSPGGKKLQSLPDRFINLKLIHNDSNKGFGCGCNIGALDSRGMNLLFLNPDTKIFDDSLEKLFSIYNSECVHGLGTLSPVFVNDNFQLIYSYNKFPNFKWEFAEVLGGLGTDRLTKLLLNDIPNTELFFVDASTGACLLIRKELFQKLKGFDEQMFLYYEDTDLQKRLSDLGYRNAISPSCRIIHTPNTSTKSVDGDLFYLSHIYRSRLIYFKKHLPFTKLFVFRLIHICGFVARISVIPFRDKYKGSRAKFAGLYITFIKNYLLNA